MSFQDRVSIESKPVTPGWYGLLCGDGEGEVWTDAARWDGVWCALPARAYARSAQAFETPAEARDWASEQPD